MSEVPKEWHGYYLRPAHIDLARRSSGDEGGAVFLQSLFVVILKRGARDLACIIETPDNLLGSDQSAKRFLVEIYAGEKESAPIG